MANVNHQSFPDLHKILQERFSFSEFREGQREAIEALLHHGSLLCIQPTGHGKSLLYQLPAVLFDGVTLVISPLLALMRDQLSQLNTRFKIPAASINSDQSEEENFEARQLATAGKIKILFVSPEQLDNLDMFRFLLSLPIDFLVVDEAHCISTWGHDFRPSYRQIVAAVFRLKQTRPRLSLLGLTATADKKTERDIALQLQLQEPLDSFIHRYSMDRPNLSLSVEKASGTAEKLQLLTRFLSITPGCTVIYCATRENTVVVSQFLRTQGFAIEAYHAGLTREEKRILQNKFFAGELSLIAATNALGMGIDKQDIRLIVHFDVPGSITAYYQEVGRAGRDGQAAHGVLLFDERDRKIQEHFINSAQPSEADFGRVLTVISSDANNGSNELPTITAIKAGSGLHPTLVTVILAELTEQGFIEKRSSGKKQVYVRTQKEGLPHLVRYAQQAEVRSRELGAMMDYGHGNVDCYMAFLRRALGDDHAVSCGRCAKCVRTNFEERQSPSDLSVISDWLESRFPPIEASSRPKMSEGLSVLDGSLRTKTFMDFMRSRRFNEVPESSARLSPELKQLIARAAKQLGRSRKFAAVVMIPSRTWAQREETGRLLSTLLDIPFLEDLLYWKEEPKSRQGELLNNDQRRENVKGKLGVRLSDSLTDGGVLLVDDYIGSGATMREAASGLRYEGQIVSEIVPLTIARIRWRLGQKGMV